MAILYGFSDRAIGEYLPTLRIRDRLAEMKKKVRAAGDAEYKRLLSKEVTALVDNIATGVVPRPGIPIVEEARNLLDARINTAIGRKVPTEFNMRAEVKVIIAPDLSVFYSVTAQNRAIRTAIFSDGLKPCHVKSEDSPNMALWSELLEYEKEVPTLNAFLYPQDTVSVNAADLTFPSVYQRANILARHRMQNIYLSAYSLEPQIPQNKLMAYLDEALEALSLQNSSEYRDYVCQLKAILPEITAELITKTPDKSDSEQNPAHMPDSHRIDDGASCK